MKIIAIDLTYNPYGGSQTQIISMLKNIKEYKSKIFIIYTSYQNYDLLKEFENESIMLKKVRLASYSKPTRLIWVQFFLPFQLLLDKADLLFCPGNFSPIFSFINKIQSIGTIGPFEKGFYKNFSLFAKINLYINRYLMIFSSYTSQHVIFLSNYTRDLFASRYNFNILKSTVINLGRDDYFHPVGEFDEKNKYFSKNKEYILSVSHLYPYKNLEVLFKAFQNITNDNTMLLIAGSVQDKSYHKKLVQLSQDLMFEDKVFFLGSVSKNHLRDLYSSCKMLVFTSPYENYAHILIEAMSCGLPIVCSNTTAMPETCQSAAVYFEPNSPGQLTKIIINLLNDNELLNEYKHKSLLRSSAMDSHKDVNQKTNQILNVVLSDNGA